MTSKLEDTVVFKLINTNINTKVLFPIKPLVGYASYWIMDKPNLASRLLMLAESS